MSKHSWLPESEWLSKLSSEDFTAASIEEFSAAVKDCPASVQLYLRFAKFNPEALKQGLSSLAVWDLKEGHELWIQLGDAEAAKRATSIPYERSDLLASAFPQLKFAEPLKLPSTLEEFSASVSKLPASMRLSLMRFKLEKELSFSTSSWLRYLRFLEREMPIASALLEIAFRFTRARPDRKESCLALMDALLMAGRFEDVLAVERFDDCDEVLLCKLAALKKSNAPPPQINEFILFAAERTQNRKFLKFLATFAFKNGLLQTFRSIWKHSLLKANAKEASLWLEYIRLEATLGAEDANAAIASAFKQALNAVDAKDKEILLAEWLNHERLNGDGKSICEVKARFVGDEAESVESLKESNSKRPRLSDSSSLKAKFNPQATLFANNLPYSFTQADLEAFFAPLPLKSVRMHMNGSAFKGHATVEFATEADAASALQSHNRQLIHERPVFLAPYQSPFAPAPPSALTTKDPKTLFISHLPAGVTDAALEESFSGLPGFREVRHTPGKCFAYVEFVDAKDAASALELEISVQGRAVKMAISEPPIRKKADEQEKQKMLSMKPRSLRK